MPTRHRTDTSTIITTRLLSHIADLWQLQARSSTHSRTMRQTWNALVCGLGTELSQERAGMLVCSLGCEAAWRLGKQRLQKFCGLQCGHSGADNDGLQRPDHCVMIWAGHSTAEERLQKHYETNTEWEAGGLWRVGGGFRSFGGHRCIFRKALHGGEHSAKTLQLLF